MNKKHIHLLIGLVIIVLSLFYAFRGVEISELKSALLQANYAYLLPAIFIVAITFLFRAMRWRFLIRSVKEVKTTDLFSPLMVGFMGNMLPARAGEFIRIYLLSKKENISFSSSTATIVIERLFDLALVLLLLLGVLLFIPEVFTSADAEGTGQMIDYINYFGKISLTIFLLILVFSFLLQFKNDLAMKIVNICIKPFSPKWKDKIVEIVHSFTEGLKILRDVRGFISTVVLSFLVWAGIILTNYPLILAFGIENQLPVISSIVVISLFIAIFITIFPTPGFLGSFHLACVAALHGIFGIDKATALSFGIVAWIVSMGFVVGVGAIFAIKEHVSFGDISASKEKEQVE